MFFFSQRSNAEKIVGFPVVKPLRHEKWSLHKKQFFLNIKSIHFCSKQERKKTGKKRKFNNLFKFSILLYLKMKANCRVEYSNLLFESSNNVEYFFCSVFINFSTV